MKKYLIILWLIASLAISTDYVRTKLILYKYKHGTWKAEWSRPRVDGKQQLRFTDPHGKKHTTPYNKICIRRNTII